MPAVVAERGRVEMDGLWLLLMEAKETIEPDLRAGSKTHAS